MFGFEIYYRKKRIRISEGCLKDDVLPEMLSSLKCSLPKANGYYHPLAISFPGYWIPWSVIDIRSPKANGHYLPLDIVSPQDIFLP